MKQSGIRIGISRRTGLTALDILRILPGYDVSAEVVLLTADQADGSPEQLGCDAVLLSEQDFDLARELAEKSFTAVLIRQHRSAVSQPLVSRLGQPFAASAV